MARDFSGTLVSKLFEPEAGLKCVERDFCCDWISKGGRCQRTMAPNYSSLAMERRPALRSGIWAESWEIAASFRSLALLGSR